MRRGGDLVGAADGGDAPMSVQEHAWVEVTDTQTRHGFRVWMCNRHPGEQREQKAWLPPPDQQDEVKRLRGLLGRLEWAADVPCHQDESCGDTQACPACGAAGGEPGDSHYPGCWLAEELGRPTSAGRDGPSWRTMLEEQFGPISDDMWTEIRRRHGL
jgi:hypothetical protein